MHEYTTQTTRAILTTPGKGHTTIVTSFRRNGMGVGSPVGTVASQGKLYFMTPADTWKVKRLAIEGTARRLTGSEFKRARDLLRVGVLGHFWGIIFDLRYPGEKTAVYEIELSASRADHGMTASAVTLS
jgi:hypothetical protein